MSDSEPKIIYKQFDVNDTDQRMQIRDLINDAGMHCTDGLPDIGSIALLEGRIIGFIGGHMKYGETGHIDMFVVERSHQREGIGLALGKHIVLELHYRGCTTFTAVTEPTALSAIALYRSLGAKFKVIYEFESDVIDILTKIKTRLKERSNEENIHVVSTISTETTVRLLGDGLPEDCPDD